MRGRRHACAAGCGPLPIVGWVFEFEWQDRSPSHAARMHRRTPTIRATGKRRDPCVPVVDPREALAETRRMIAEALEPGAEIVAMREADRRDITEGWTCARIGPRRRLGFAGPRGGRRSDLA